MSWSRAVRLSVLVMALTAAQASAACWLLDSRYAGPVRCPGDVFPATCPSGVTQVGIDPADGFLKECVGGGVGGAFGRVGSQLSTELTLAEACANGCDISGITVSTPLRIGNPTATHQRCFDSGGILICERRDGSGNLVNQTFNVAPSRTWTYQGNSTPIYRLDGTRHAMDLFEHTADPSTPATSYLSLYPKAGGLYAKNAAGTVTGPLVGTGNTACATYENVTSADDDMFLTSIGQAATITSVWCNYKGSAPSTAATFTLQDGAGNAMTITGTNPTCAAQNTVATAAAVTAGNTLSAREVLAFDVTNTPNPATQTYQLCVSYTVP